MPSTWSQDSPYNATGSAAGPMPYGSWNVDVTDKYKADTESALAKELAKINGEQARATQAPQIQRDIDLGNIAAVTSRENSARDNNVRLQEANNRLVADSLANDTTREGNRLAADTTRYTTDVGARTTSEGNRLAADTARRGQDLSLQASLAPVNFARDKFDRIFPLIEGGVGSLNSQNQGLVGGTNAQPPKLGSAVYSDADTQQQVNAQRATIDQQTQTQQRANARSASGRGFGANSPLLAALNQQAVGQGMAAGADAEREIRYGAKTANAGQALSYDQLAVQQADNENRNDIERRKTASNNQNQLLQILAGLA